MSVSGTITKSISLGGQTFNQSSTPSADAFIVHNESVAAGEEGSLTTRTDADTGVITVDDSGHSFAETDRVDVYWTAGCRRGMSVSSVTGAAITVDGGSGDDLPAEDSTVTIIEPVLLDLSVLGTRVEAILLSTDTRGQFVFIDDGSLEAYQKELGAGYSFDWIDGNGTTNPITGDQIEGVYISHDGSSAATMKVGILHDNS